MNAMKKQCLITTVTMTLALKGKRILEKNGIVAAVTRLPPGLSVSGCAYGIAIDGVWVKRAKEALEQADLRYGKLVWADGRAVVLDGDGKRPTAAVTGTPRTTVSPKGGEGT